MRPARRRGRAQQERRHPADRPARRPTGWSSAAPASSDARGAEAVLTEAGLARLRAASRTHLRGISEHFLDVVDADRPRRPSSARCAPSPRAPDRAERAGRCAPDDAEREPTSALTGRARPAVRRDERVRLSGLVAAVLPGRTAAPTASSRHYAARLPAVELNNTYYQSPTRGEGRRAGSRRRPATSGSRSRPSAAARSARCRRTRPTSVAVADRPVPSVRGAAGDRPASASRTDVRRDDAKLAGCSPRGRATCR